MFDCLSSNFHPHSYHNLHHHYHYKGGKWCAEKQSLIYFYLSGGKATDRWAVGSGKIIEERGGVSLVFCAVMWCDVNLRIILISSFLSFSVLGGADWKATDDVSVKKMSAISTRRRSAFDIFPNWTSRGASSFVGFYSFPNLEKA